MKLPWMFAVAALLALPIWVVSAPAMPDYPAHLASYWLIAGGAAGSPFYHVAFAFLPNLAGEVLIPLLGKAIGVELAAKLFLTVALSLWVIGPALVQRALFGRIGVAALFASFFAYNANFTWGFLNYLFAMGAAFVILAAWIASEGRRTPLRIAGFMLAATAIYFSHLFALATLGLMMLGYEAPRWREWRARALPYVLVFVPAALAFLFLRPHGRADNGVAFNLLGTAFDRVDAALQLTYDNPSYVLLALLVLLFVVGLWQRWLKVHPRMVVPLVLVAVAAALAPEWAMGGWAVHMRLPAVLGALAFASSELDLDRRRLAALAVSAATVLALNAWTMARDWRATSAQYDEFRAAARALPPHLKLLTVLDGNAIGWRSDQPYWHMAEFAIPDANALTPLLFTTRDQHVVQMNAPYRGIVAASAEQGSPPDIDELEDLAAGRKDRDEDIRNVFPYLMYFQCRYDVAVVVHLNGKKTAAPPMLALRHAGSFFDLYDVRRDASCAR
jgi:hypothetical protein